MRPARVAAYRRGRFAELVASFLLMAKGYRILERRYRSPVGEIDLVAARRNRLAFVEVKVRRSAEDAAWSITPNQQQRIRRAAESWLARRPKLAAHHQISFDVVLVSPRALPRHIVNAFGL